MGLLALAAFAFLGLHVIPMTPLRAVLTRTLGDKGYLSLYALCAIVFFVLWTRAFAAAPADAPLWNVLGWWPWIKAPILLVAGVFLVAGVTAPKATAVQSVHLLANPEAGSGIFAITRHPALWAIGLWGASHLISQPNLRGLLFFGLIAALAFLGMLALDMRKARAFGDDWQRFAARTSLVPFLAMAQGRAQLSLAAIGWWRIAAGVLLWAAVLHFHLRLFGVHPLPGLH